MKTSTKWIASVVAAAAIFIGSNVKAQSVEPNALRLGIGVEGLLPVGNLHDVSNVGLGGTARLQYGVNNSVALMLTSGYYNFFGKTVDLPGGSFKYPSTGIVPVKVGAKAFVANGFYFSGEVGAGFETKGDFIDANENGNKDTKLILSPGLGWANKSWDVGARYENMSGQGNNLGMVGLRIAYGFGL